MHPEERHTDVALVRRLLRAQIPQWAEEPLEQVPSAGTDNALYRLGEDRVVRLPRVIGAVASIELEQQWLPRLALELPVEVPTLLAVGRPNAYFPWPWSVFRWIPGRSPTVGGLAVGDAVLLASDLADFLLALQRVRPAVGPVSRRGVPLHERDEPTRAAIRALADVQDANDLDAEDLDVDALTRAWERALAVPPWAGPPVWLHGDLAPGNLLVSETDPARLSAVIDWGCLGIGDPACELTVAWNLLPAQSRRALRASLGVDDDTWHRGRGWALSIALIQLPYYRKTNLPLAASSRHVLAELAADEDG